MRVGLFFAVTFGFSWFFGALTLLFRGDSSTAAQVGKTLLAVAFMFGPLVGAVVAQRAAGEKTLKPLGAAGRVNPWWLLAWIGPFAYAIAAMLFALPLPGVEWSPDLGGFWERLAGMMPPEALAEARAEMEEIPRPLFFVMILAQSLLAGPSINAIAAFGEELGWRGFLFRAWAHLGFWRASLLIGLVWGIWHAPLIAQGHNYPDHPFIGVAFMVLWCTLLAPPFHYIRLRTGSVVAAAIMHGTLNACAGLAIMFVRGGSDLLVGVTGLAGVLALVVVNGALLLFARDLKLEVPAAAKNEAAPPAGAGG